MTKIASMKVQVSADTRRFDMAMKNVRNQMRASREGVSSAAAVAGLGAMGGVVGGGMGVMALSGPMAAVAAAATAMMALVDQQQRQAATARDRLATAGQMRMDPLLTERAGRAAGAISPGASAKDVFELLGQFQTGADGRPVMAPQQRFNLLRAGMPKHRLQRLQELADNLGEGTNLQEALFLLKATSSSADGKNIAKALQQPGLFNMLASTTARNLSDATGAGLGAPYFQAVAGQEAARARSARGETPMIDPDGPFAALLKAAGLMNSSGDFNPGAIMGMNNERALTHLENIDRKSGGPE